MEGFTMKKRFSILVLVAILSGSTAMAQFNETNNLFYNTFRTPQTNLLNPALFPNASFYLTLPGLNNLQFGSPLAIRDLIHYDPTRGYSVIDINHILDVMEDDDHFRFGLGINLLGFGFKVNNLTFNFNTRVVGDFGVGLPVSVLDKLLDGNIDDNNQAISEVRFLDGSLLDAQVYTETSVGVAYKIAPINTTFGFHLKVLGGLSAFQLDSVRFVLHSDAEYDNLSADAYYNLRLSLPGQGDLNALNVSDIIHSVSPFGPNSGIAFDLGVRYDLGPFAFSLAINDLTAGIHWTNNIQNMVPKDGHSTLNFSGVNLDSIVNGSDGLTTELENFINGLQPDTVPGKDFWTNIPTKVNLGATYTFANLLRAGILFHGQFDRGIISKSNPMQLDISKEEAAQTFRFNTTLSAGVNVFNWLEFIIGSSVVFDGGKADFFNPGAGVVISLGTALQTYLMADYVSSIYALDSKAFNLKFGFNLVIGKGGVK